MVYTSSHGGRTRVLWLSPLGKLALALWLRDFSFEGLPSQVWQRRPKEGTVQEGVVVLYDFDQLVPGTQHPRGHICKYGTSVGILSGEVSTHRSVHTLTDGDPPRTLTKALARR